ncbi:MAG: hypothetical protein CSA40_01180 [Flavobacteriales bacterium]|nr:MAG: hypothetical protein CSA40_01180 [Flavobacteriales bacterium]
MFSAKEKQEQKFQKLKQFAIFFVIAIVFWLLMSISAKKTARMTFKFRMESNTVMFLSHSQWEGEATAIVEASGLVSSLKKTHPDILTIKETWVDNLHGGTPYVLINNFVNQWQKNIVDIKLIEFDKDTLWLPVKRKSVKRIPVNVPTHIQFKPGYKWASAPKITPDSIDIVGSQVYLDALHEVTTDTLYYKGVDGDLAVDVPLKSPFKEVFFKTKKVRFAGNVLKFTENTIQVPLMVTVDDRNYQVEVFPKTVQLTYQVAIDSFKRLTVHDFEVSCVIDESLLLSNTQDLLTPRLSKKPEAVVYYTIAPKQVKFFAYKKNNLSGGNN